MKAGLMFADRITTVSPTYAAEITCEPAACGLQGLLHLDVFLFVVLGMVIGLIFGAIPGLGGTTAIALLMPLTYGLEPFTALALAGGVMGSEPMGGSITSILLNTPGTAPNAATCLDGHPLAQQGKAGLAIGAAGNAAGAAGSPLPATGESACDHETALVGGQFAFFDSLDYLNHSFADSVCRVGGLQKFFNFSNLDDRMWSLIFGQ